MSDIANTSALSWCGAARYNIGDEPSSYVARDGCEFFARHLSGSVRHMADFGCWTGRNMPILTALALPCDEVYGVDGVWARDAVAGLSAAYPRVRLTEANLHDLPFPDGHLAAALCWRVLHNITDFVLLMRTLREFARVLAHGAPLLIAVRRHEPGSTASLPVLMRRSNGDGGMREDLYFSAPSLVQVFPQAGFRIAHVAAIEEGEVVEDKAVLNGYWAVHLVKEDEPCRG